AVARWCGAPRTGLGSSSAMTAPPGSATRTATEHERRLSPALLAHRADAALGERLLLLLPARDGTRPLPAEPVGRRRSPHARAGRPLLVGDRMGLRPRRDRPRGRPARDPPHRPRDRRLRPRR